MGTEYTNRQYCHIKFTWKINALCMLGIDKDGLMSPAFSTDLDGIPSKWKLWVKTAPENAKWLHCGISLPLIEKPKVTAIFKLKIYTPTQEAISIPWSESPHVFLPNRIPNSRNTESSAILSSGRQISKYTGEFVASCEFKICCDVIELGDIWQSCKNPNFIDSKSLLVKDYTRLFMARDSGDVTLVAGDKEYKAHKAILQVRSPVFEAMLVNDMLEKQKNRVSITDVDPEILIKMLEYIYTGETSITKDIALDLMYAAHKYKLDQLELMCADIAIKALTANNAVENLIWAERYECTKLLVGTQYFIKMNKAAVIKSPEFQALFKNTKDDNLVKSIIDLIL